MRRHGPVIVQCTDCVVFLSKDMRILVQGCFSQLQRFVSRACEASGKHSWVCGRVAVSGLKNVTGAAAE